MNQTNFFMPASLLSHYQSERAGWLIEWRAKGCSPGGLGMTDVAGQYTGEAMDRVRFGRALGYGARHAAKTLLQAADAASTPAAKRPASGANAERSQPAQPQAARVAERVVQTQRTVAATKQHAGKLGRSVWTPVARFSSVVWLQVTGLFFALIAMFLAQGAWKERAAMHLPLGSHAAAKFYVLAVAFAAFAYFSVSNFVRAYLRERK
jgi:hypothetical protein